MNPRNEKKKLSAGKIIGLLLALLAMDSDVGYFFIALALVLLPIGLAGYLVFRAVKNRKQLPSFRKPLEIPGNCIHKDKAIHHVRRGKELDPWDRPDIDISKYQRKE